MAVPEQITRFWLDLFKASCYLSMKQESDDDIRPLSDYLKPKVKVGLDEPGIQASGNAVTFLNLKNCYEKVQTRRDGMSAQRPMDCNIRMLAIFDPSWTSRTVEVFVQRLPESARLCGDLNGRVKLDVMHGEKKGSNMEYFSVDLDSVYKSHYETPVYKLSTVDPVKRNRFLLIVRLSSPDQMKFQYFTSPSFLVRSRKPKRTTMSLNPSKRIKLSIGNTIP